MTKFERDGLKGLLAQGERAIGVVGDEHFLVRKGEAQTYDLIERKTGAIELQIRAMGGDDGDARALRVAKEFVAGKIPVVRGDE